MIANVIEATTRKSYFTGPGGDEWALLLFFATQDEMDFQTRLQKEDAAMDAEDAQTQAEEALVMG